PMSTSMILENDSIVFKEITYLGSASVNAPRSETEITRNMAVLNRQSQMAIPIELLVPSHSEGTVHLMDPATQCDISTYKIHRILFCARGPPDTNERRCFAFTCSHGENPDTAIFQCHVFKCDVQEAQVSKILYTFATAFRRSPKSPGSMPDFVSDANLYKFNVSL
ncbi:hypothetical protein CAPTEDRAFT_87413, partial [Capitella teleta]